MFPQLPVDKTTDIHIGEKRASSIKVLVKLDSYSLRNETRFLSLTLNKTHLQINEGFQVKTWLLNVLEKKIEIKLQLPDTEKKFLNGYVGGVDIQDQQLTHGTHKTKELLNRKVYSQLNEVLE